MIGPAKNITILLVLVHESTVVKYKCMYNQTRDFHTLQLHLKLNIVVIIGTTKVTRTEC